VGLALGDVGDEPLVLERAEDGENRRVRERVVERVADFGDGPRTLSPENGHDVELAIGEGDFHGSAKEATERPTKFLVDNTAGPRACQLVF
jgi:hypothetical protein